MQTMRPLEEGPIVVAGAGSIGGYVGGALAMEGRVVRLLGRERLAAEVAAHGLRVTGFDGLDHRFAPDALPIAMDPALALAGARVVLVAVKSAATAEMGRTIARHAPPDAIVVSYQNGVANADALRETVDGRTVLAGMVPFNVVQMGEGRFHRATSGAIKIDASVPGLAEHLSVSGVAVEAEPEIQAVLWGKLLINLNNALNALSDLPLLTQLQDRRWRRLMADAIDEGLGLLKAAGVTPKSATGAPPRVLSRILRLPNPLFRLAARAMPKIDPNARSSMWEDLKLGRKTEIDALQGAILELAAKLGRRAPLAERIVAAIRDAEAAGAGSPGLSPETLRT